MQNCYWFTFIPEDVLLLFLVQLNTNLCCCVCTDSGNEMDKNFVVTSTLENRFTLINTRKGYFSALNLIFFCNNVDLRSRQQYKTSILI